MTLFHLLANDEIGGYVKTKLGLDEKAMIYPAPNLATEEFDTCLRPDFVIVLNGVIIGYIEVELGTENNQQLQNYRKKFNPVYSIVGKKTYPGANLSLEEILEFICSIGKKYKGTQTYFSMKLFVQLIKHYILDGNFSPVNYRQEVSEKMKKSFILQKAYNYFGSDRIIENGSVRGGAVMLNTVKENGFSMRVYSPNTGTSGLSVMARTGGSEKIIFPTAIKLKKYLPHKINEVENFVNLMKKIGYSEIEYKAMEQRVMVEIATVENNIDEIFDAIGMIAGIKNK